MEAPSSNGSRIRVVIEVPGIDRGYSWERALVSMQFFIVACNALHEIPLAARVRQLQLSTPPGDPGSDLLPSLLIR